ncbi:mediator complex subunit [Agyrium rufum]|nr:mediator complex subunit [Agyrium rufum]
MPGFLHSFHNNADDPSIKSILSQPHMNGVTKTTLAGGLVNGGMPQTNGAGPFMNGVYDVSMSEKAKEVAQNLESMETDDALELTHITEGYLPLTTLIIRMAQETYLGVDKLINDLANLHLSIPQVNGAGSAQGTALMARKKEMIWDFMQDRRTKLIKILVLLQWSRQAEAVGRAIDINVWLSHQRTQLGEVMGWMAHLRRSLAVQRMPSADFQTAVEVLSTGQTDRLPDLGYVPSKPLSSKEMLRSLRKINTLLTIRLAIHDTIPMPFRNYSVANGRATFHVAHEFELDLSIADEEPTSQLYFIDFRYSFNPCERRLGPGRLRDELEATVNDALRTKGLQGCFDFLHNLTLTHKINILRQQFSNMVRKHWADNLKIEVLHRSLVVQYWIARSGAKNWIEIGVNQKRQRSNGLQSFTQELPQIAIRWHRHRKEILEHDLDINPAELSLENLLRDTIRSHTNHIFKEMKRDIRKSSLYAEGILSVKHRASKRDPARCALNVQLTSRTSVELLIEPVSGAFAVKSPSPLHGRAEYELNSLKDPAVEGGSRISQLRCATAQAQIEAQAKSVGWKIDRNFRPAQDTVKHLFSPAVKRFGCFRLPSWDVTWVIVSTTSMDGDAWWLVEMSPMEKIKNDPDPTFTYARTFKNAYRISSDMVLLMEPSYRSLMATENTAAAMLSQLVDSRELLHRGILHRQWQLQKSSSPREPPYQLLRLFPTPEQEPKSKRAEAATWFQEMVKISFLSLTRKRDCAFRLITVRLRTPITGIGRLTDPIDSSVAFHPDNGCVTFRLSTPLGKPLVDLLLERLNRIQRLVQFLKYFEKSHLQTQRVSLCHLTFNYNTSLSPLTASLDFSSESSVKISFAQGNPHLRIQDYLTKFLNGGLSFEKVLDLLRFTLPVLRALDRIEASSGDTGTGDQVMVLARSPTWFMIRYAEPRVQFEIYVRHRVGKGRLWLTALSPNRGASTKNGSDEAVQQAWKQICTTKAPTWTGLSGGVAAQPRGIEDLIARIDAMVKETTAGGHEAGSVQQSVEQDEALLASANPSRIRMKPEEIVILD